MDISSYSTNKVLDYYKEEEHYHYVITVCDEASKSLVLFSQVLMGYYTGISQIQQVMEVMKRKKQN